jgi:hypothetical protein
MIVTADDVEPAFGRPLGPLSGTRQAACGLMRVAISSICAVAAISKLSGLSIAAFSRSMSASVMWRRSSRRCAVMPSAPASMAKSAARTGSGRGPPRAFRKVATWSILTPRRSAFAERAVAMVQMNGVRSPGRPPAQMALRRFF